MSLNSPISDETLLGYVLIALPEAEQWRIEALAFSDPELAQRIDDLRDLLGPMQELSNLGDVPAHLTEATMAYIQDATQRQDSKANAQMSQPMFENSRSTRLAWLDSLAALTAGVVILSVLLPSVWHSRESARRITCTANLREIGSALVAFANSNAERRIPRIELAGPLSFAGVYAVRLKEAGLLESQRWIWCPATESLDLDQSIPSVQEFVAGSPRQQLSWTYIVGGNYSFNLGNMVDGDYETPSFNGKSYFAVLGDSLLPLSSAEEVAAIHGVSLANVLYDDGRIQSVMVHQKNAAPMLDNPYLNRAMQQAVGQGVDDTCLGPSFQNPFKPTRLE